MHEGLSATQHIFSASREAVKVCNYLADVNILRFQAFVLLYTLSADHQFCCAKLRREFAKCSGFTCMTCSAVAF